MILPKREREREREIFLIGGINIKGGGGWNLGKQKVFLD